MDVLVTVESWSADNTPTWRTMAIPADAVLAILNYTVATNPTPFFDIYHIRDNHSWIFGYGPEGRFVSSKTRAAQAAFASNIRVCKAWYLCGAKLLYETPMINSPAHLHLLARTVKKRRKLAVLVRSILLDNQTSKSSDTEAAGPKKETFNSIVLLRPIRQHLRYHNDFASILKACKLARCLALRVEDVKPPLVMSDFLYLHPRDMSYLKELSLHGGVKENMLPLKLKFNLPALEDLSLHRFDLQDFQWPQLQSLRTIRVFMCRYSNATVVPPDLPSLHTIELVAVQIQGRRTHLTRVLHAYAQKLKSLQIGGTHFDEFFGSFLYRLDYSKFTQLKRLVLLTNLNEDDPRTKLPKGVPLMPRLEELVVISNPSSSMHAAGRKMELCIRNEIVRMLEHERRLPALTRLTIMGDKDIWSTDRLNRLKTACRNRGVKLELELCEKRYDPVSVIP